MLELLVKYFVGQDKKLESIEKGDWVDVYANEDVFVPTMQSALVPLGFAMKMPDGYEGVLAPRSSTMKTWGCILANGFGVIDNSYCGENDQWMANMFCLVDKHCKTQDTIIQTGTWIRKGDKIAQFRIQEKMKRITIREVLQLQSEDRGGFGSTGSR